MKYTQPLGIFFVFTLFFPVTTQHHNKISSKNIQGPEHSNFTLGGLFFLHYKGTNNEDCGDFHAPGLGHVQAMIYAIERINSDPKLLPNITLGYDIHDYCESASLAVNATYKFVKDMESHYVCPNEFLASQPPNKTATGHVSPLISVIGPGDSGSSVLVGSLLKVAGVPAISFGATSEELSSPFYKHFYRTVPSDKQQASAMADLFEYFGWNYVGAVAVDDSYGRYGVWALEKESFTRKSFCIALSEYIPRLNYMNKIKIIISKLKRERKVKVIVLWLFGGYGKSFLKEAEKQQIFDRTWILSDALASEQPRHVRTIFNILDGSLGIQPRFYQSKDFESYLSTFAPKDVKEKRLSHWWEEVWRGELNCSVNQSKGWDICKENTTLSWRVISKLYDTFLPYVIEAVYAVAHALHKLYFCVEPYGLLPGGKCSDTRTTVKPLDVDLYLRNVSFQGLLGKVEFNEAGDPLISSYDIINFQKRSGSGDERYQKVIEGSWDKTFKKRLHVDNEKIKWSSSFLNSTSIPTSVCSFACPPGTLQTATTTCCWECTNCPIGSVNPLPGSSNCSECAKDQRTNNERTKCEDLPIANIKLTDITGLIITGFVSLGVLLTLFSSVILLKYRETPLVKASSRELSAILLLSITVFFAQTFLSLIKPTNLICRLRCCFSYAALGTCVATLMIKTLRILSVFHANLIDRNTKQFILTTKIQASFMVFLNGVVFCLLTSWLILDPPSLRRVIQRGESIFLTCQPHSSRGGFGLHVAINCYIFLLSLISTIQAFKARKLPENFNEARYIGLAMYILLLSTVAYFPVDFVGLENWSGAIVACATTLVSSYGLLGCMFAPKIYVILCQPEQNTIAAVRTQVSDYTFRHSLASSHQK